MKENGVVLKRVILNDAQHDKVISLYAKAYEAYLSACRFVKGRRSVRSEDAIKIGDELVKQAREIEKGS